MSCENPIESAEAVMPKRRMFSKTGICIKCKASPGKLVIRHAVYCKACFLVLMTSKFRQVLDPTINSSYGTPLVRGSLKASGNLMIGYSGGLGSTVLLDLVKSCYFSPMDVAMDKGGKKHPRKSGRAWDRVIVCYVECCQGHEGSEDRTQDVRVMLKKYQGLFEFYALRLEDAFNISDDSDMRADLSREDLPVFANHESDVPSVSLLKAYLASLPTATSHQKSIASLTRLLLQHTARALGCSHLLLGTTLTGLSINLIDAVASGAGFTIALEKAEDWQSHDSEVVRVIRPLREISMKECAAYTWWRDLSVIGNRRILSVTTDKDSIGSLTKDFIIGLERDYPSTVSAIVRTCNKLVPNTDGNMCVFCERPVQPGVKQWKERSSLRTKHNDEPSQVSESLKDEMPLTPHLCYACHTILTSRSSRGTRRTTGAGDGIQNVPLPFWVGHNLQGDTGLQTRAKVRQQIKQFLIDSNGETCEM